MSSLNNNDKADPKHILSILDGYRRSQTLFTAVSFKLFDHLNGHALSLEELSNKLNLPQLSSLERFLNACVALQLIQQDKTTKKYSNTELSHQYLVSTSPTALDGYINHNNNSSYLLWSKLPNAVHDNASQWHQTFGATKKDEFTFDTHYRDENAEMIFMSGMHGLGTTCFPNVVACVENIQQFKTFCDVGGATGCLSMAVCKVNPHLKAIIFDLPCVEKHTIRYVSQTSSDIRERIRFQSGDFFVDNFPEADLFGLGRILHDWNDEKCHLLLKKIYQTLPANNGAILLAEKLLNEDKAGPIEANMQDLNMLVATAGRERTPSEYKDMLEKVGFKNIQCHKTGQYLDAIIGYK